ncbi:MAG TPA: LysM peptidoglycan-binding domain-containing protein [Candidatus Saccharimonadales bacterium]|nr:LysM peptidoglycan-binding domain-containing protein [Candidatus Saccharimonadales bacterium]
MRRRIVRVGLLTFNVALLAIIAFVVLQNSHSSATAGNLNLASNTPATIANPLDQVSSADIALTVARLSSLPETTAITDQVQSQAANVALASDSTGIINKPEVVATALKSRADIKDYTSVSGDTVSSIAAKFGVTSDSIRWSNDLSGDAVAAGTKLLIPPVNGIVYVVQSGDTPASLASRFHAEQAKIIAYNDAEIGGLKAGEHIIIPGASEVSAAPSFSFTSNVAWGIAPIYGYNGYDFGYCTWYVATQVTVPANWGNASTWAYYAGQSGWKVSGAPSVGAIAQTAYAAGGEGHVAIVRAVKGNQVLIEDMNGIAGWDRVGKAWEPISTYEHYITK